VDRTGWALVLAVLNLREIVCEDGSWIELAGFWY